jgi:hypothetical protein
MCTPAAAAGAAISAGGSYLQNKAAGKAAKQNQASIDRQTALGKGEFDKRYASAQGSDARTNELVETGFSERQALEDDTFRQINAASTGQIVRDTGSTDDFYGSLGDILAQQGGTYDATRSEYDRLVADERARQEGFRGEADTRVDSLIGEMGTEATNADRAKSEFMRGSLADFMANASGVGAVPDAYAGVTGPAADAITLANQAATDRARQQTGAASKIAAYGDATREGTRRTAMAGEDLNNINLRATASGSALAPALGVEKTKYANATDRANQARSDASAGLEGKLRLSSAELQRSTQPLKQYATQIDNALADYYKSRLTSESDYTGNIIGSSQRYEDINRNLTNYKVANNRGSSPIGDLMVGLGGSVGSASGGPSWGELGTMVAPEWMMANAASNGATAVTNRINSVF